MIKLDQLEAVKRNINLFRDEDEVAEVRILNTKKRTVSGYFNNPDDLVEAIKPYMGEYSIYFTLNPVCSSLLARAFNKLVPYAKHTTTDKEIEVINFILIDLDPERPSGISSTDAEHELAQQKAVEIRSFLSKQGFPEPIMADSGNGYHLLYYVELKNNAANVQLVKDFLAALDFKFSDDNVKVDVTTYNSGRITKLYGTPACKGDNTEERPHRVSEILYVPDEYVPVTAEQLASIGKLLPKIEMPQTSKLDQSGSFDIEDWMEKHNIKVASSNPYQNKGTLYRLNPCPWNPDHTDHSAYIIRFNNGAICAGCHHDSCADQNWHTLRDLLEPGWRKKKTGNKKNLSDRGSKSKSKADVLIELVEDEEYFLDQFHEAYAVITKGSHFDTVKVESKDFGHFLRNSYEQAIGKAVGADAIKTVKDHCATKAFYSNDIRELYRRVGKANHVYYYDLADLKRQVVKITSQGCEIDSNPPSIFTRLTHMKAQVEPDLTIAPKMLSHYVEKHFRFKRIDDRNLFMTYLCSCFLPEISHPILILHGVKGSAKSTTMKMIRSIVDPSVTDLLILPNKESDMTLTLANNYMPCFDNMSNLSSTKSDIFCCAVTGAAIPKRKLYTNDEEIIFQIKRCLILNGINNVATKSDLLDRSILLELERIPPTQRKTDEDVFNAFGKDKPGILGACLNTVSQALACYPNIQLTRLSRMADYTKWGYAIAEVLGIGGENFQRAYEDNQKIAVEEAVSCHPVAASIISLMRSISTWEDSMSKLWETMNEQAQEEHVNIKVKEWPKAPNQLRKRLNEVKADLEQVGISYFIRNAGDCKKIAITNKAVESLQNTSLSSKKTQRQDDEEQSYPIIPKEELQDL